MKLRTIVGLTALVAALVPTTAAAHVTANPGELTAGFGYTQFRVGHGCDGSPTTKVSIKIPEGVASVHAEVVPGWEISTKQGQLATPVNIHGEEVTEGVTEVTWTGGPLDDAHLQHFGLSFYASEELAGETAWFPVVQTCQAGEHRWIEIPVEGGEEPAEPAPGVALLAAETAEETAEEAAAESEGAGAGADASAAAATGDDDDSSGLALGFGIAGLAAGLIALGITLFRPRRTTA